MDTLTAPPHQPRADSSGTSSGAPAHDLVRGDDRMLAGVASAIARYCGVEPLVIRLAFAVLAVLGGAGIPLYLACWALIPARGATTSIAADAADRLRDRKAGDPWRR